MVYVSVAGEKTKVALFLAWNTNYAGRSYSDVCCMVSE